MDNFLVPLQIRWSDIDANSHLRHSVYYDWGAQCRLEFLGKYDLTTETMQQIQFGPILFREECVFRREVRLGDTVTISLEVLRSKRDFSRWTIRHTIKKNPETVAAILTVDGAWIDTQKRKLAAPPPIATEVFGKMPRAQEFQWED